MLHPSVSLTQDLIRCESVTPHEGWALRLLEKRLKKTGFTCERMPFSDTDTPDVDNLYARFGKSGRLLCFAGHTDVVPPGDKNRWQADPFAGEIRDGMLFGRGAADMKGGIAAFIVAAENFLRDNPNFQDSIGLIITGDEEGPSINGTKKMVAEMKTRGEIPVACLVGEPTNPEYSGEMIKVGRRGSLNVEVTVVGKQGHVAYPHRANNPVHHLVMLLHHLTGLKLDEGNEFFQPSCLQVTTIDIDNPTTNLIPETAFARFNIRFSSEFTGAGLIAFLEKIFKDFATENGCVVNPRFILSGESFLTRDDRLITTLNDAIETHTGRRAELSSTGGTSDARFIKDICPVVEYGLIGATMHQIDERVATADIVTLTQIYQEFLHNFFNH